MKIVHLIYSFQIGGAETMLVDILNHQVEYESVSLIIINNEYSDELLDKISSKVNIYKLNRKPSSKNIFKIVRLNILLKQIKPDIVHLHHTGISPLIFVCRDIVYLTVHAIGVDDKYFARNQKIFAISNAVKNDIRIKGNYPVEVVYNGIDSNAIKIKADSCDNSKFRILQVGRLYHSIKGQHILITALSILVNQKGFRNICVDFIGDGPSFSYLKKMVDSLELAEYVNFIGLKDREYIYNNLCNYNLYVQPSLYEGFGLTVVEAMAAKVPVLISANDGPLEIIDNGRFGEFFIKGDCYDCANKIEYIYNNYSMSLDKSENAYFHMKENFSIKSTSEKYLNLYKIDVESKRNRR